MRLAHEKAPGQINDLRKRFAKEFTDGFLSKEDFDQVDTCLGTIDKVSKSLEKKHAKGK